MWNDVCPECDGCEWCDGLFLIFSLKKKTYTKQHSVLQRDKNTPHTTHIHHIYICVYIYHVCVGHVWNVFVMMMWFLGGEKNITQITQITQKNHSPPINPLRERPLMKKSVMCVIRVMCVTCVSQESWKRVFIFFYKLVTNSPHKSSQSRT